MKIQILDSSEISNCIDGYSPVLLENGTFDVEIPNNSVSDILINNAIEKVPYSVIDDFLTKITKLLRINGKLVISGVEANCLCRDFLNKLIDCNQLNVVLYNRNSIYDSNELCKKISSLGLVIDKITFKGSIYELYASRPV